MGERSVRTWSPESFFGCGDMTDTFPDISGVSNAQQVAAKITEAGDNFQRIIAILREVWLKTIAYLFDCIFSLGWSFLWMYCFQQNAAVIHKLKNILPLNNHPLLESVVLFDLLWKFILSIFLLELVKHALQQTSRTSLSKFLNFHRHCTYYLLL